MIQLVSATKQLGNSPANVFHLGPLDLEIGLGDYLVLRGVSGSGKSSLLSILGCALPLDGGRYLLNGNDTSRVSERELAKIRLFTFGFVYQGFHLVPYMSVAENVQVPMGYAGLSRRQRVSRTRAILDDLGLLQKYDAKPSELSGGQQQRVAIARALANSPTVILADEPTGNLDSESADDVLRILSRINETGTVVVVVTHDPRVASCGRKVIHLADGKMLNEDLPRN